LVPRIFFYCEDEDEVKRLATRLVVEEDKYLKVEKLTTLGFQTFSLILCCFALLL
jgi:hypothetical protein